WETRPLAEQLVARVRSAPGVARAEIAGSVRRYNETNGDIDIVAAVNGLVEPVMEAFAVAPGVAEVLARGGTKCSVRLRDGLQADLRVVSEAQFATALHHFTGSKQHHVKLRGIARDKGLSISEYGLARLDGGPSLQPESEEALYGLLGLQPVPPELREDLGELELAAKRALPELIEQRDIRGFVHFHSTWSDGRATPDRPHPPRPDAPEVRDLGPPDRPVPRRSRSDPGPLGGADRAGGRARRHHRVQRHPAPPRFQRRAAADGAQAQGEDLPLGGRALHQG